MEKLKKYLYHHRTPLKIYISWMIVTLIILGCGVKSVISEDIYTYPHDPSDFHVDNIFTHNKEEKRESYWIAPDHTQGNFIINLGCQLTFRSIKVVNTHNHNERDRSTKKFR
jgi:hypothetical protein